MSNEVFCCEQIKIQIDVGLIAYDERFDQYDIVVKSCNEVQFLQKINFCPWSGDRLPDGYRDRWFDELEEQGIDPLNDPLPERYKTKAWRE